MAIKKLPGGPNPARQKIMNAQRTAATSNAKSGETAKRLAGLRDQDKSQNPKVVKVNSQQNLRSKTVAGRVQENKADRSSVYGEWSDHPGAASEKSHKRLVEKNKWSSPKQISRYQKQEAKKELKTEARGQKVIKEYNSKTSGLQGRGGPLGGGRIGGDFQDQVK